MNNKIVIFWFRRDLRLHDNKGLSYALASGYKVVPIFIFDDHIIDKLPKDDSRLSFIYQTLSDIHSKLQDVGSSIRLFKGKPLQVFEMLIQSYKIQAVYTNTDYEPYATSRDNLVSEYLAKYQIEFNSMKDQVIFEKSEVVKDDGSPYSVYTPYKKKWLKTFDKQKDTLEYRINFNEFFTFNIYFPSLESIGFNYSSIKVRPFTFKFLNTYDQTRDYPSLDTTSYLSPYLRFGLVSVREMVKQALVLNEIFLSELIWREFFMQILWHYPEVVYENFRSKYDSIPWRNNELEFEAWKAGQTGYPMVDAGMRQLNKTGYMHNRVRMITAGFLCKHLLIDWRWGEAYFAKKLLDYDLSSNNGNWQWASGTGCDAAPYFRVFNPESQLKKFDKDLHYIRKWIPNFDELTYPKPIVEHKFARERAIRTYKDNLM